MLYALRDVLEVVRGDPLVDLEVVEAVLMTGPTSELLAFGRLPARPRFHDVVAE